MAIRLNLTNYDVRNDEKAIKVVKTPNSLTAEIGINTIDLFDKNGQSRTIPTQVFVTRFDRSVEDPKKFALRPNASHSIQIDCSFFVTQTGLDESEVIILNGKPNDFLITTASGINHVCSNEEFVDNYMLIDDYLLKFDKINNENKNNEMEAILA